MSFNYYRNNSTIGPESRRTSRIYNLPYAPGKGLYPFISATFTNAGTTGQNGPTLNTLISEYTSLGYSWASNASFFDQGEFQGYQKWTVPISGTYRFVVSGAGGGTSVYWQAQATGTFQPLGATVTADLTLALGDQLQFIVGQLGEDSGTYVANLSTNSAEGDNAAPGGGGGSFVFINSTDTTPLIVAGGGAGGSRNVYSDSNATPGQVDGNNSQQQFNGGIGGNGGTTNAGGSSYWAGAGAGWLTDGTGGRQQTNYLATPGTQGAYGGLSPRNGGTGGTRWNDGTDSGGNGGFGGGGGGGSDNMGTGGGGGFSGGGGGNSTPGNAGGGGGGSYAVGSATNVSYSQAPWGHGSISVTLI